MRAGWKPPRGALSLSSAGLLLAARRRMYSEARAFTGSRRAVNTGGKSDALIPKVLYYLYYALSALYAVKYNLKKPPPLLLLPPQ